ncbi:MAG: hypothetical protein Q8L48_10270 [Archangium sp.]|nr:hypothetical protein [Archangium sp.]
MKRALWALVVLSSSTALAYDSKCYRAPGVACAEGPDATRHRWIGESDEHRQLLAVAASYSGIAPELFEDFTLPTYVKDEVLMLGNTPTLTLKPAALSSAAAVVGRTWSVAEFAQLPDFSYSLADWALGNETCPLDDFLPAPVPAFECHEFAGHMGSYNSNHFLPQSEEHYRAYHQLALGRAAECARLRQGIPLTDRARFEAFFTACEQQALVIEAVGQHFLQDAWSSGHMWERWGSTDPRDFPDLQTAVMVALATGLTHGARGIAQGVIIEAQETLHLGSQALIEANDALCAPNDDVRYVGGGASVPTPAAGDLFANRVLSETGFPAQRAQFLSCSISGLREVYAATGQVPGPSSGAGLFSIDPLSRECFGQRVTNRALRRGAGVDLTSPDGATSVFLPLDPLLVGGLVVLGGEVVGAGFGPLPTSQELVTRSLQFRFSMMRIAMQLEYEARRDPDGTSLANGALFPLMGVEGNRAYAFGNPRAPTIDPSLPWKPGTGDLRQSWRDGLARVFHQAHALDWCAAFSAGGAEDLEALKRSVQAAPTSSKATACEVCVEFSSRHLRQGRSVSDYDQTREPLCGFFDSPLAPVQFIYQDRPPTDSRAAAQAWCGCGCEPLPGATYCKLELGEQAFPIELRRLGEDGRAHFDFVPPGGSTARYSIWSEGVVTEVPDFNGLVPRAQNDLGQTMYVQNFPRETLRVDPDGGVVRVVNFQGLALNNRGHMFGREDVPESSPGAMDDFSQDSFFNGALTGVTFPVTPFTATFWSVGDLNDNDDLCGEAGSLDELRVFTMPGGVLPLPPGELRTRACRINNLGEVVGIGVAQDDTILWSSTGASVIAGRSKPRDINVRGDVLLALEVSADGGPPFTQVSTVVRRDGTQDDLAALGSVSDGGSYDCYFLADDGKVLCREQKANGRFAAVLLTPAN